MGNSVATTTVRTERPRARRCSRRSGERVTEFSEDNLSDWAAALTYYGLLAMFPALIALVALIGLVGDPTSTTNTITQIVTKIGPSSAASTFAGPIKSITSHKSAAGIVGLIGLGGGAVVGLELRRRVHARVQRDLRDP